MTTGGGRTDIMSRGGTTSKTLFAVTIDPHKSVIQVSLGSQVVLQLSLGSQVVLPLTPLTIGDITFAGSMPA